MTHVRRLTADEIHREIGEFERKHNMSTREFIESYRWGKLPHNKDFIRWLGLCRMASVTNAVSPDYVPA